MRLAQAYAQWADFKRQTVTPSTWRDYESVWHTHLADYGNVKLHKLPVGDILAAASDGRRARVRTVLKMVLEHHGHAAVFPTVRTNPVRRVRAVPTREHVEALAAECGNLVLFAAASGLRWGEILALQADDVDGDTINVDKAWCAVSQTVKPPKSHAGYRKVVMLPEWVEAASIVPTGPIHHSNFTYRQWKPALRKLGLSWRFHDLRHYYATTLIRRNVPIHIVSKMLGHSKASVTLDIYAGHMEDDQDYVRRMLSDG